MGQEGTCSARPVRTSSRYIRNTAYTFHQRTTQIESTKVYRWWLLVICGPPSIILVFSSLFPVPCSILDSRFAPVLIEQSPIRYHPHFQSRDCPLPSPASIAHTYRRIHPGRMTVFPAPFPLVFAFVTVTVPDFPVDGFRLGSIRFDPMCV